MQQSINKMPKLAFEIRDISIKIHTELKKTSIDCIEQEVRNIVLEDNRIDSVYRLVWNVWYNVVNCG